jgi:hypothetical protein
MSLFANLPEAAPDAAFALVEAYKTMDLAICREGSPNYRYPTVATFTYLFSLNNAL